MALICNIETLVNPEIAMKVCQEAEPCHPLEDKILLSYRVHGGIFFGGKNGSTAFKTESDVYVNIISCKAFYTSGYFCLVLHVGSNKAKSLAKAKKIELKISYRTKNIKIGQNVYLENPNNVYQ